MDFTRLFVYFNECRDSSHLEILQDDSIVIHTTSRVADAASNTLDKVIGLLEGWRNFKVLSEDTRASVKSELNASADPKRHTVTVGKVREIYRKVIANQLKGFEKAACENIDHPSKRLVRKWEEREVRVLASSRDKPSGIEELENIDTAAQYWRKLVKRYGQVRVDRVMRAHAKDMQKRMERGLPLHVEDVHHMTTGLVDFNTEDLQHCYEKFKELLEEKREYQQLRTADRIPKKIKKSILGVSALKGELKRLDKQVEMMREVLNEKLKGCEKLPENYTELNPDQIKFLIGLLASPLEELEKTLLGKRMEGVVEGAFPFGSIYCYFYSKLAEDMGRIQAIQEVMEHQGNNELFFLEMWTKLFVKKEVSKQIDLLTGMIVPGLNGEWYRINNKESSKGKFVFCLEPLTNPELPSFIMQRSTASSPSSSNPVWTIVQDTNPFAPPGYFAKKVGLETEFPHFYEGTNDLVISGHSLGGSFTQLNMINFLKKMEEEDLEFPERNIKLVIFDAPAIMKKDAVYFANWAKNNPEAAKRITIEYYFSKSDTVPGAGTYHLGVGCEDTNVTVRFTLCKPKEGASDPELNLHPHGRFFYRNEKTMENTHLEMKGAEALKAYDKQTWRLFIEILRRVVGMLVFLFLLLWLALKTIVVKCIELRNKTDNKVDHLSRKQISTADS